MRLLTIIAIIVAGVLFLSSGAANAAPSLSEAIQKTYESMEAFSATFTQRLVHQESGSEETRNGNLLFQKPLRIRWETQKPDTELLVVSEKEVWDYLPDEEVAYRYSPEVVRDSRSVLQVITGQTRLDVDFSIESEKDENGMAVLRLYPREPSTQMVEAVIWVDKDSNLIRKAQILDFYGNTNEVTLNSLTPDAPIPAGAFQFTPPKGISIEDLTSQTAPERPLLK